MDPHVMASGEKVKDVHPQPGICKLLHGLEKLHLVDSKLGPVPFGSVLSYQWPPEMSRDIIKHPAAAHELKKEQVLLEQKVKTPTGTDPTFRTGTTRPNKRGRPEEERLRRDELRVRRQKTKKKRFRS